MTMSYDVVHYGDLAWEERPGHEGEAPRQAAPLTEPANMTESRARRTPNPSITSTSHRPVPPTAAEVPIGRTGASGSHARARASSASSGSTWSTTGNGVRKSSYTAIEPSTTVSGLMVREPAIPTW